MNRKNFIRKSCLAGACLCGFGSVASASSTGNERVEDNTDMVKEWLAALLTSLDTEADEAKKRKLIRQGSVVHYNQLKMNEVLAPFKGNMGKFISFLEKEWNWKVAYDKTNNTIVADENKNYCVCPLINRQNPVKLPALCYCSEGIAEKMFSEVACKDVEARVISSIQRGDDRCRYKIVIS